MRSLIPHNLYATDRSRTKGFTLIELLTVIAIIGILAAILIPVVGKVRDNARASLCLSNLRQISMGLLMYADDNSGILPTSGDTDQGEQPETDWILWRRETDELGDSAIVPYLGGSFSPEIYACPSDERIKENQNVGYAYSYTLNRALGEGTGTAGFTSLGGRVHNVKDPSLIILMVEEAAPNDSSAWLVDTEQDGLTERHSDRGHVSFVDGHVELVYPEFASYRGHWDPFAPASRPYDGRR